MNIEASKIDRGISNAAKLLLSCNASIGSVHSVVMNGHNVTSKLYGFNVSRKNCLVEVSIDGVMLDRVLLKKKGDRFEPKYKMNYNKLYDVKSKAPVQPPVDEAID